MSLSHLHCVALARPTPVGGRRVIAGAETAEASVSFLIGTRVPGRPVAIATVEGGVVAGTRFHLLVPPVQTIGRRTRRARRREAVPPAVRIWKEDKKRGREGEIQRIAISEKEGYRVITQLAKKEKKKKKHKTNRTNNETTYSTFQILRNETHLPPQFPYV